MRSAFGSMSRIRSAIGRSAGSSDASGSGGGDASAGVTVAVVSAGVVAAGSAGVAVSAGAVAAGDVSEELPIPWVPDGVAVSDAVGGASVAVSGIGTAVSMAAGVWVLA